MTTQLPLMSPVLLFPHLTNTLIVRKITHLRFSHPIGANTSEANSRQYVLPNRSTRGQLTKKYEPTLQAKAKYHVANFMSTKRLSKSYESFVNQISTVSIPKKVHDALGDTK